MERQEDGDHTVRYNVAEMDRIAHHARVGIKFMTDEDGRAGDVYYAEVVRRLKNLADRCDKSIKKALGF